MMWTIKGTAMVIPEYVREEKTGAPTSPLEHSPRLLEECL